MQHLVQNIVYYQLERHLCNQIFWHHLNSSKQSHEEGVFITSYEVMVLFTSVPVDPAISIIKNKLEQDTEHNPGTIQSIQLITTHL